MIKLPKDIEDYSVQVDSLPCGKGIEQVGHVLNTVVTIEMGI